MTQTGQFKYNVGMLEWLSLYIKICAGSGVAWHTTALAPVGLFQCKPSSEETGQIYTPSIPDFFFDHMNAADLSRGDVNKLSREFTHIISIPAESAERNCSGTAMILQYCYTTNAEEFGHSKNVFNFLILSQDRERFRIKRKLRIMSQPTESICTAVSDATEVICCDTERLSSYRRFQIPRSPFTFGILPVYKDTQLLVIPLDEGASKQYRGVLQNSGNINSTFTAASIDEMDSLSLPLLRISLEPDLSIPETTNQSSTPLLENDSTSESLNVTDGKL